MLHVKSDGDGVLMQGVALAILRHTAVGVARQVNRLFALVVATISDDSHGMKLSGVCLRFLAFMISTLLDDSNGMELGARSIAALRLGVHSGKRMTAALGTTRICDDSWMVRGFGAGLAQTIAAAMMLVVALGRRGGNGGDRNHVPSARCCDAMRSICGGRGCRGRRLMDRVARLCRRSRRC